MPVSVSRNIAIVRVPRRLQVPLQGCGEALIGPSFLLGADQIIDAAAG